MKDNLKQALDSLRLMQSLYECDLNETAPEKVHELRQAIAGLEAHTASPPVAAEVSDALAEFDQLWPGGDDPVRGRLAYETITRFVALQQQPSPDGRGTDAQIEKEREIARHAIVGALAAGYAGQDHPGAEHWLAAAHDAGVRIEELEKHARQQAAPMPPHTLALMADIDMIELHDENGPGRVFCPACGAYMQMQWKAGKRTDEVENLPHDEKCPAVWARAQLSRGITQRADGEQG